MPTVESPTRRTHAENSARLATRIVADLDVTHPDDHTVDLIDLVRLMTPRRTDDFSAEQSTWWGILHHRCTGRRGICSRDTMRRVEKILVARM